MENLLAGRLLETLLGILITLLGPYNNPKSQLVCSSHRETIEIVINNIVLLFSATN